MHKQEPIVLPLRLLQVVFQPTSYTLDKSLWEKHTIILSERFARLSWMQQQLLWNYYSEGMTQTQLAAQFSLSPKQCSQELRKALHALRKAANPFYQQAIAHIHSI